MREGGGAWSSVLGNRPDLVRCLASSLAGTLSGAWYDPLIGLGSAEPIGWQLAPEMQAATGAALQFGVLLRPGCPRGL